MEISRLLEYAFACVHLVYAFWRSFVDLFLPVEKKSISGEIALVTGAGRGLGKDVAIVLSENGCRVVVVDINLAAVQQTAAEINQMGGCAMAYKCDVSNWDDVARLRDLVEREVGPVDILVNNAGLIVMQSFVTNTRQDIERTIAVNVNGVLYMTRQFLETMIERRKGHIVTVTSTAAYYSMACAVLYCTTKAASNNFMLTLTEQLRHDKLDKCIKTTNILPYVIDTPASQGHSFSFDFLKSRFVAEQLVQAMQENRETLFLPSILFWGLKLFNIWPVSVQRVIKDKFMREPDYINEQNDINTVNDNK